MYARKINDKFYIGFPRQGTLNNGRTVSRYDLLMERDESLREAEGWLPLEDVPPAYNAETHYIRRSGYDVREDKIVVLYEIIERPESEPDPLEELQTVIADLAELVLEMEGGSD